MTRKVRYVGDVNAGPSPAIFPDLGNLRADADMGLCVFYDNDFIMGPTLATATAQGEFYSYQDSAVTITTKGINDTDKELGVLQIDVLDTDNDEGLVQFGQSNQWRLDTAAGNTSKVGYEVRFKVDEVAANQTGLLLGLVEGAVGTQHIRENTGGPKTAISFLGFQTLAATPTEIDVIMQNTAASPATATEISGNAATLVVNTYTKLGLLFDPYELDATKKVSFYKDGVAIAYANATQVAGSNFPLGEGVVPVVGAKTFGSGTSGTLDLDRITAFMYKNAIQ
jgi:hypothetical protein